MKQSTPLPSQVLDNRWLSALHAIGSETHETYLLLMPPLELLNKKRHEFEESGYTKNIPLEAIHIETNKLEQYNDRLHDLRQQLEATEPNEPVQLAYIRVIDELLAKNELSISSAQGDQIAFAAHNGIAYGRPDPVIFAAAIQWVRYNATQNTSTSRTLKALQDTILKKLPDIKSTRSLFPSQDTFHQVKKLHENYFMDLFGSISFPDQNVITEKAGDKICKTVLDTIGSNYALADSSDGIWGVTHKSQHVVRPPHYSLPKEAFIGIVCHEIGSHLLEAINGSHQKLRLLQTGLDHHEHSNEGRALLREQIVYDNCEDFHNQPAWEYAVLKHILISLAEGLYDHHYTFSEIYSVAYALFSYWREVRFPDNPNNESTARDEAWHVTVRVLKGTDGNGGAYTKDIIYLEGNLRCWDAATTQPELILYGDYGKFDITNEVHLSILRELSILPEHI